MRILKSFKSKQRIECGNKWKGSWHDVFIFLAMVIVIVLILSFIFRYFIECDIVLINSTTETLTLVADWEHIFEDPKFEPLDKKTLLNIKPSDSLKLSHFRKWNSSEILPRYYLAETSVVFFMVKNNKWDIVSGQAISP